MIDQRLIRSDPDGVREALTRRGAGDERRPVPRAGRAAGASCWGGWKPPARSETPRPTAIAEARQRGEDAAAEIAAQTALKAEQAESEAELAERRGRGDRADARRSPTSPTPRRPSAIPTRTPRSSASSAAKPEFWFPPRDHLDIAGPEGLGLIDVEDGARVSGSRFHYLLGDLVRLEFALVQ